MFLGEKTEIMAVVFLPLDLVKNNNTFGFFRGNPDLNLHPWGRG